MLKSSHSLNCLLAKQIQQVLHKAGITDKSASFLEGDDPNQMKGGGCIGLDNNFCMISYLSLFLKHILHTCKLKEAAKNGMTGLQSGNILN